MSCKCAVRDNNIRLTEIPSIDRFLQSGESIALIAVYGRTTVTEAIRCTIDGIRLEVATVGYAVAFSVTSVLTEAAIAIRSALRPLGAQAIATASSSAFLRIESLFRALPVPVPVPMPVVGRLDDSVLIFNFRCREGLDGSVAQLGLPSAMEQPVS